MEKRYDVWVEITANKEWILDAVKFEETMKKCRAVGMTGIILSVKDTTGFSLYPSQIAPHYSKYDKTFLPAYDYVKQCFSIIKNLGMKCYAAFDTFAAGNGKNPHPDMPGIKKDGFACEVYGLDADGKPVIRKQSAADHLHTVGSIDDFGEIFLNPGNEEVQAYVLALLKEFVDTYHPDGIVLDRVRYVGLSTDFSEQSRKKWEAYSGISDERWPEDMYTIVQTKNGYQEKPGRYFGTFITWRMQIIHDFIVKVKQMLREYPDVEFCDYTGSWYPLYYQVGVNWADQTYAGNEFPGVIKQNCSRQLMQEKLIRYFPAVIMRMSPYQRRKRTKNQQIGTAWKEPPGWQNMWQEMQQQLWIPCFWISIERHHKKFHRQLLCAWNIQPGACCLICPIL